MMFLRKWLLLAVLFPAGCIPAPAANFNVTECYQIALNYLKINAPPALVFDVPGLRYKGMYYPSTIKLRDDATCATLVHEMAHHKQFMEKRWVLGADRHTWYNLELEAAMVEAYFLSKED